MSEYLSAIEPVWNNDILPKLEEYIKIPNKSPAFDKDWKKNGYMDQALQLAVDWVKAQNIPGLKMTIDEGDDKVTPLLLVEIEGQTDQRVLMYGHFDKQPEMTGWEKDLGPWKPVMRDGKLYGRGGADDGYALFSSLCAVKTLQEHNKPIPNIILLIEFSEESGSCDLEHYVNKYKKEIGQIDLVVCLDASVGDYERFWVTTSLRGLVDVEITAQVLEEGIHSGDGSGVVPSSFRVLSMLMQRLENLETGEIHPQDLKVDIPSSRIEQAKQAGEILGEGIFNKYPIINTLKPMAAKVEDLVINRTWKTTMSYIGAQDIPSFPEAGNVLRPQSSLKLSFRLPPTLSSEKAAAFIKKTLTENPPYGARVTVTVNGHANGWHSPELSDKLANDLNDVSQKYYGEDAAYMGTGGSIPFIGMLGEMFPKAEFIVTGVLGPRSNAHGPNEFLHVPYVKKLTACVTELLEKFAA